MRVETFCEAIAGICGDFFVGVPDSQLKALCDYLMNERGVSARHIIAANEGNCTALACGYRSAVQVDNYDDLEEALGACKEKEGPLLIEAKASIGCRDDLGRPTTTAQENKQQFMNHLKGDR